MEPLLPPTHFLAKFLEECKLNQGRPPADLVLQLFCKIISFKNTSQNSEGKLQTHFKEK